MLNHEVYPFFYFSGGVQSHKSTFLSVDPTKSRKNCVSASKIVVPWMRLTHWKRNKVQKNGILAGFDSLYNTIGTRQHGNLAILGKVVWFLPQFVAWDWTFVKCSDSLILWRDFAKMLICHSCVCFCDVYARLVSFQFFQWVLNFFRGVWAKFQIPPLRSVMFAIKFIRFGTATLPLPWIHMFFS